MTHTIDNSLFGTITWPEPVEIAVFDLDVRSEDEYAVGHRDGSANIPLHQLPFRLHEVPRETRILTWCESGMRAATGASILRTEGFDAVVGGSWRRSACCERDKHAWHL